MDRAYRALPGRRYDRQRVVRAQQGGGVQPVQMDGPLPRGGTPAVSLQVERGVELDEGRAPRPRAAALQARSPLPIRVNRGQRCISLDAAVCALIGAGGYCGPVRGRAPAGSGRFRRKRALSSPWVLDFCAVFGGVCRRRLHRPGETPALGGVSGRFGLRNRPEVASGVRESLGERGGTVLVDELDAKLRPKPLRYVILLFTDSKVNKNGAQLIFSSQDVSTMRNDVFRRDEIWFAARAEGEASQLWSLADTRP